MQSESASRMALRARASSGQVETVADDICVSFIQQGVEVQRRPVPRLSTRSDAKLIDAIGAGFRPPDQNHSPSLPDAESRSYGRRVHRSLRSSRVPCPALERQRPICPERRATSSNRDRDRPAADGRAGPPRGRRAVPTSSSSSAIWVPEEPDPTTRIAPSGSWAGLRYPVECICTTRACRGTNSGTTGAGRSRLPRRRCWPRSRLWRFRHGSQDDRSFLSTFKTSTPHRMGAEIFLA